MVMSAAGLVMDLSLVGAKMAVLQPLVSRNPSTIGSASSQRSSTFPSSHVLPEIPSTTPSPVAGTGRHGNMVHVIKGVPTQTFAFNFSSISRNAVIDSHSFSSHSPGGQQVFTPRSLGVASNRSSPDCPHPPPARITHCVTLPSVDLQNIENAAETQCAHVSPRLVSSSPPEESRQKCPTPSPPSTQTSQDNAPLNASTHHLSTSSESIRISISESTKRKKRDKKKKKKSNTKVVSSKSSAKKRLKSGRVRRLPSTDTTSMLPPTRPTKSAPDSNHMAAMCQPIKMLPSPPKHFKPKIIYPSPPTQPQSHSFLEEGKLSRRSLTEFSLSASSPYAQQGSSCVRISVRRSADTAVHGCVEAALQRVSKVYLSEKQSASLQELGLEVPCAPPGTPAPEMLERYEYVPSMTDVRAQRAVRVRLEGMEQAERRRLERIREDRARVERAQAKDQVKERRRRQRLEIYALNKIMTNLEYSRFVEFCSAHGLRTAKEPKTSSKLKS